MIDSSSEKPVGEFVEGKKRLSKIHFLIHPGYTSNELRGRASREEIAQYNSLLDLYVKKAEKISHKDDELMFAFIFSRRNELAEDSKEQRPYIEKLRQIKSLLGKKLIVFSGNRDIVTSAQPFIDEMKRLASARGYVFDSEVLSEAYGEALNFCVRYGATNLNQSLGLDNKTVIKSDLTSAVVTEDSHNYVYGVQRHADSIGQSDFIEIEDLGR